MSGRRESNSRSQLGKPIGESLATCGNVGVSLYSNSEPYRAASPTTGLWLQLGNSWAVAAQQERPQLEHDACDASDSRGG